jgi:LacI family transcriptional regulator
MQHRFRDRHKEALYVSRKVTINMLAERAGVSRGTVDRVLNQRPHVKPELYDRVILAMKELNYVPPRREQAVALGLPIESMQPCILGVLLRDEGGFFKSEVLRGIEEARKQMSDFQVEILVEECTTSLPEEASEKLRSLASRGASGIAVSVVDQEAIVKTVNALCDKGIYAVTFNTDLSDCKRLCFVGQDLERSGRIAAELMSKCVTAEDKLLIAIGNPEFQAHRMRLQGFQQRMSEKGFRRENMELLETYNDYSLTYQKVRSRLKQADDIKGIYMANHSVSGCVQAVREADPRGKIHIISHDLTDSTRRLLQKGEIDFAISQDIFSQAYRSLEILQQCVQKNIMPNNDIIYPAINIYCSENL